MPNLKGKIALITGASRGIGRELAWKFAQAECDLALLARSQAELNALAWEIKTAGREALALTTDLRDDAQIRAAVNKTLAYFGRVDILVNNAGLWRYALTQDLALHDWDEMFDVNVRGAFLCAKYLLPAMLERGHGHIVNIGSISGLVGETESAGYNATKWALRGFSHSLYKEVGPRGVRVTLIEPGWVNNEQQTDAESQNAIQVEDVADVALMAALMPKRTNLYEAVLWNSSEQFP
jgi:3-oxoacyl-[acyl-carrier protein] reductase